MKRIDIKIFSFLLFASTLILEAKERWMEESRFGLMFHYEAFVDHTPDSYNRTINSFDLDGFIESIAKTGTDYIIFVIGQHWGKYCAPNQTYEKLLGVENGVWTSKRDLIMEIAQGLAAWDIKLIIYMTARAPMRHYKVIQAMQDTLPSINGKPAGPTVDPMSHPRKVKGFLRSENQPPNPQFLKNWGDVCGEWSKRYGKLVSGWWFDGYKTEMRDSYEDLKNKKYNIDTWIKAVHSGNPNAELAFNAGAHPLLSLCTGGKLSPHQTFTSGENHGFYQRLKKGKGKALTPDNFPAPDGVIWHLLLPISNGWGSGNTPRFDVKTLTDRIGEINAEGGIVTLDTPISPSGKIPGEVLKTLSLLGKRLSGN